MKKYCKLYGILVLFFIFIISCEKEPLDVCSPAKNHIEPSFDNKINNKINIDIHEDKDSLLYLNEDGPDIIRDTTDEFDLSGN